ncbi:MAG: class I SAM-dependent methyltransferase [Pseudomonadota bacterium]
MTEAPPDLTPDPTLAFYDEAAARYAEEFDAVVDPAPLQRFMADLTPGGRVLDLGCGAGWASAMMSAASFRVRAVDGSPGLVAQARARGVEAEVMLFQDLAETDAYDGVFASFSLLHAPKAEMPGHLARIRAALRPGGRLYLGMKLGDDEKRDRFNRLYAYWTEKDLRAAVEAAGFVVTETQDDAAPGMAGEVEPLIHLYAHA